MQSSLIDEIISAAAKDGLFTAMLADSARLRRALRLYGCHLRTCQWRQAGDRCSCGLLEALVATEIGSDHLAALFTREITKEDLT